MKGGFNNPPNEMSTPVERMTATASMKGGFNNPPNRGDVTPGHGVGVASMKGGFNNPPNCTTPASPSGCRQCFNEGGVQ